MITRTRAVAGGWWREAFRADVRAHQAALVELFTPNETIVVDAPHAMVPVVPDEIADAVLTMVESRR